MIMIQPSQHSRSSVRVIEVGPRDGLQSEPNFVSTKQKIELINRLVGAGLRDIEVTSFVSPKWVPQLSDHALVMDGLKAPPGVQFSVLTPNLKGFEQAIACGATEVAVFASASEAFSMRNINCSIAQSLERLQSVGAAARQHGVRVRGYVSCVVACPYEGAVDPERVSDVVQRLMGMGCYEISLADTIGVGTPDDILRMLETVSKGVPMAQLAGHYHDTYGMALANIYASYQVGMRSFDSSIAGLGGCPYARGASGNVATEDLVYLFNGMGVDTGLDIGLLTECSEWVSNVLNRENASRVSKAMLAKRVRI